MRWFRNGGISTKVGCRSLQNYLTWLRMLATNLWWHFQNVSNSLQMFSFFLEWPVWPHFSVARVLNMFEKLARLIYFSSQNSHRETSDIWNLFRTLLSLVSLNSTVLEIYLLLGCMARNKMLFLKNNLNMCL